jgi:hypothetical protein
MGQNPCCCKSKCCPEHKPPSTITGTVTGFSSGIYATHVGESFTLTKSAGKYVATFLGLDIEVRCRCGGDPETCGWVYSIVGEGNCSVVDSTFNPFASTDCDPFYLGYASSFGSDCGGGSLILEFSE